MKSVRVLSRSKMMAWIILEVPETRNADAGSPWVALTSALGQSGRGQKTRTERRVRLLGGWTDRATQADLTVVDADVEAAGGIRTDPGLVRNRGAIPAVIRERYQHSNRTFTAIREIYFHLPHSSPPHMDHDGAWRGADTPTPLDRLSQVSGCQGQITIFQ